MDRLDELESQSIFIFREAFARMKKLALLWSLGKDSNVMIWLARKAFFGHVPFPAMHVIGVGSIDWFRCPLPPNRTCEFPAYGSPVGGFTCERTDRPVHRRPASCRAQALQSKQSASVFGRHRSLWHSLSGDFACAGCFAACDGRSRLPCGMPERGCA